MNPNFGLSCCDDCAIRGDRLDWLLAETDELIAIFVTMSKNVKLRLQNKG